MYADGKPPTKIAHELNAQGIPGPRGKGWGPSTLFGNVKRGNGILNNELYIGKLVWNRQRFLKDPATGRRVARPNPQDEWVIQAAPDLRIIDDALWKAVKQRQAAIRARYVKHDGNGLSAVRRTRYLFSGLIKCAQCGGGYSMVYRDLFGCSTVKNKGTCSNRVRITCGEIESRVLAALRNELMDPALFQNFCKEYISERNRQRMEASSDIAAKQAELDRAKRGIRKIIEAIKAGYRTPEMKEEMFEFEDRKARLTWDLANAKGPPALLHPD